MLQTETRLNLFIKLHNFGVILSKLFSMKMKSKNAFHSSLNSATPKISDLNLT